MRRQGKMVARAGKASHESAPISSGYEVGGETSIDDDVISSVAVIAAGEVQGVASLGTSSIRRTWVEIPSDIGKVGTAQGSEKEEVVVNLTLNAIYGYRIPDIVSQIRMRVADRLQDLIGISAREINIEVADIEFPERTLQE